MSNDIKTIELDTTPPKHEKNHNEIDLREVFNVIWKGKWTVAIITVLMAISSVYYAIQQPNIYKSEALLAPAETKSSGGLSGIAGQFGGLASLAGVNLGSQSANKTQLALEVLKSRIFTSEFIKRHKILPDLMAVKSWELSDNRIEYNAEMYNEKENKWLREVNAPFKPEPSMQEAYEEFSQLITADMNKESGMITIAIEHVSPVIAQRWVNWLIEDINTVMKSRDVEEANKSTEFLTKQLEHTKVADIRTVLYKLIEEQTKTIMFANVRDEYVFKTIDPALVPEKKFKPGRALICIFGFLLGGFLGVVIVVSKYFLKNEK